MRYLGRAETECSRMSTSKKIEDAFMPNENNFTPIFGSHALQNGAVCPSTRPFGRHLAKECGEVETFIPEENWQAGRFRESEKDVIP